MKKTLNIRWLQAGLACAILTAGAGVALGQYYTYDTTTQNWSGSAYLPGGTSALNTTWGAGYQSTLSGAGGGIQGMGNFNEVTGGSVSTNWARAAESYNNSGFDVSADTTFTLDLKVESNTPLDTTGSYGSAVIWFQWSTTGTTGDNNGNNVPYLIPLITDNNWHTYTATATQIMGTSTFSALTLLHVITVGVEDNNYFNQGTITGVYDLDNVGFVAVPEPTSLALLGIGAVTLGMSVFRRKLVK